MRTTRKSNRQKSIPSSGLWILVSVLLFLALASVCSVKNEKTNGAGSGEGPDYCPALGECFDDCNTRYPPQHGSNEIEVCLYQCIQKHGTPEPCGNLAM
ncbi:MAG: hypothetical protein CMN76_17545 [Spirochaetaceae bacterium]|nr:hypothetical protein [Spirochaetaceae bacterium]